MKKAKVVYITYNESDTITYQGKRANINKYLKQGYSIKEERNGFWVLIKPVTVIAMLENDDGEKAMFNIKEDILRYYNRKKISEALVQKFIDQYEDGKITFYMEDNSYSFK